MPEDNILKDWHEFYLLVGTAAAALIALLFVAASIGAGVMSPERASATRIYMSPVIFHFSSILLVSLTVLVPSHPRETHTVLIGLNALVGAAASTVICTRVFSRARVESEVDWIDWLAHGVSPVVAYMGAFAAAVLLLVNSTLAPDLLAVAVLVLLIANIRNAWDITLVMARRRSGSQ
jgi:predicted neutral ceramidase superfamily lipid hydrolase